MGTPCRCGATGQTLTLCELCKRSVCPKHLRYVIGDSVPRLCAWCSVHHGPFEASRLVVKSRS